MNIKNIILGQIYSYVDFQIKIYITRGTKILKFLILLLFSFISCEKVEDDTIKNIIISWQKCFGGTSVDEAHSIQQTTDAGYIVAGYSYSNNGDVSGNHNHGYSDYWIVKLTSTGNLDWQKCLGGNISDEAYSIQQTTDGGYIIAGRSDSNDGDLSMNHGNYDFWIVKLTSTGQIEWQKSLGGSGYDEARSIQQTTDAGYIVAGYTESDNGDVSGYHGGRDYWIVKLASTGKLEWQKCLGGSESDRARSIQQTTDGGYIVAGYSYSNNGDVSGNHGDTDYWIVKLTSTGKLEWQKCFGGSESDGARSIQQTTDGGYIIAGSSSSKDSDVSGNHGWHDYWIVKLTSAGELEWQKCLGGSGYDEARSIQQTTDAGYIVAGFSTYFNNGDVSENYGWEDYWIVKLTSTGELEWQKSLGGSSMDLAESIQQTTDGGYIIAGHSWSKHPIFYGNHGSVDYWIVKISEN